MSREGILGTYNGDLSRNSVGDESNSTIVVKAPRKRSAPAGKKRKRMIDERIELMDVRVSDLTQISGKVQYRAG